ncbi:MAG: NrtA/SsuA/CpmA family ABC transporter substrate-binding protein [Magnetococcales bacterium]|nr:NrtA/SsuA/CpmA family ABC transporter substrate-binding protein [Magnetococcales bacterium]
MKHNRVGISWLLIGLLLIPAGFVLFAFSRDKLEKLTIASVELPTVGLLFLAEAEGFFAKEGLEVTFKDFSVGRDALTATLKGEADIATVYETVAVLNILKGEPIAMVSTLHQSSRNTALVARKDRKIDALVDLIGKRIGVTFNTSGIFFLRSSLNSQGIATSQVTLVDTPPDRMVASLQSGAVDAVATWAPFTHRAVQAIGEDNATLYHSDVYTEISLLVGRREALVAKQEALTRLLRALLRAEAFLVGRTDEAYAAIARRLNINDEEMRKIRGDFTPILTLDNILLTILRQEATWFVEAGGLPGPVPDFRSFLFPAPLEGVKPEYITIL